MKKLEDYLKYEQPNKYIVANDEYSDEYDVPVLTAGKSFVLGYTNDKDNIFPKEQLPVIIFDDFTTDCKYVNFPFKVKSSAMKILHPINNANAKFLYYYMTQIKFDNTLHKRYWISEYSQLLIKELSDVEQNDFAKKMSRIEVLINIISEQIKNCNKLIKSQFVEMFGDPVDNKMNWDVAQIGDICFVTKLAGFEYSKYINYKDSGDVIMIRGLNVKNNKLKLDDVYYIDKDVSDSLPRSQLHSGDICMTYVGINIGDVAIVDDKNLYHLAPNVAKISLNDKNKINPLFFVNLLAYNKRNFASSATNTAKQALNMEKIRNLKVMMPPIKLQNKFASIVEQIDKQKFEFEKSLKKLEELQASLMQEYFG